MSTRLPVQRELAIALLGAMSIVTGCRMPGHPPPGPEVPRPEAILSFEPLYRQSCAGCHGAAGKDGSAIDLANPVYQGLVNDATLRQVIAKGEPSTLMPGFSKDHGGMLTDQQIEVLVHGMRQKWGKSTSTERDATIPPYGATSTGDVGKGAKVYQAACARCHGAADGNPGPAGNVLDGTFLSLLSPQSLRSIVIAGRPDLGHPDWRKDLPDRPLSEDEVGDLVAWMMSLRPVYPGNPYPNHTSATSSTPQAPDTAVSSKH